MDGHGISADNGISRTSLTPAQRPSVEALEPRLLLDGGAAGQQAIELFGVSAALFAENRGQWADPAVHYAFDGDGANTAAPEADATDVDFGDAPSPYPTQLASDGAWHSAAGPRLGINRDSELDGQPTVLADGDDTAGVPDDEDGVTFGSTIAVGQLGAAVTVNVQNAPSGAKLDAWIDFNADGTWGGPFEQIADIAGVVNGDNTITFDVPSWAVDGTTYGRFRLSTAGGLGHTGPAADGEVEDYQVTIAGPPPSAGVFGPQNEISSSAAYAHSVFAADVDGDGDMDVLSASADDDRIVWYENNGSESFTEHEISHTADQAASVFAADVDGDGDMDVLSASYGDEMIAWYENDGSENFTECMISTAASGAWSVFAADVDGDGDMDVLSASYYDETIAWYENDGSENFTRHAIMTAGSASGAYSVFAADVDGDGDIDVLSAAAYGGIAWYENDGGETFTPHTITDAADRAYSVFAADVDGDGDMDVLSASYGDEMIAWYENDGSENFTECMISTAASGAWSVFAADVDGDGDMDVLSASYYDETIAWYENDGSENFTRHAIMTAGSASGAYSVFAADVDGDGDMDVLSAAAYGGIAWYKNISAPTDILLSDSTVAENEPVGSVVGTFSTTDPDANDTHSYTLVAGAGSDDNASFTIDSDTLETAESFDYEAKSEYAVRVRTTDSDGLWYEEQFTITVTDDETEEVTFADAALEQAIRDELVIPSDPLTEADMLGLTALSAANLGIVNLTGLEHATNLGNLNLYNNLVADLSPLSGLTSLTHLNLSHNEIADISPLAGLTNLIGLWLPDNHVSDISPLSGLTNLTLLDLYINEISDISPLAGLTSLTSLYLLGNRITHISSVQGLTNLARFDVYDNYLYLGSGSPAMAVIQALEAGGTTVNHQPQFEPGDETDIAYDLGSLGVDPVARTSSQTIGDGPYLAADVDLHKVTLAQPGTLVMDVDAQSIGSPLDATLRLFTAAGVEIASNADHDGPDPYLFREDLAAGTYYVGVSGDPNAAYDPTVVGSGASSATTGNYDLRILEGGAIPTDILLSNATVAENEPVGSVVGTFSTIDADAGDTHTYALVAGAGSDDNASFTIDGDTLKTAETFDFEAKGGYTVRVRTTDPDGLWYEEQFTISVIDDLTEVVTIPDAALEQAVRDRLSIPTAALTEADMLGLTELDARGLGIVDPTGLERASNLTNLVLYNNRVIDLAPLAGLTNLTVLHLARNEIVDISPLAGLTNLVEMGLDANQIRDISPLSALTNLTFLWLHENQIRDITPVAGLTNLTWLHLHHNEITGISPVSDLPNLTRFDVYDNYLYLGPGSPAMAVIRALEDGGLPVNHESQNEPGDTMGIAYTMGSFGVDPVGREASQTIGDGPHAAADVDLYKVTLAQPGTLVMDVDAQSIGSPLDATLRLFTAAGVEIASNADHDGPDPYLFREDLAAGTYYVGVSGDPNAAYDPTVVGSGASSATTGNYDLRILEGGAIPTDILLSNATVAENEPVGTAVGTFSTTDPDTGDTHTYALVTGAGDDDNASFTIDGDTLRTAETFDFEAKSGYTVRVRTTDPDSLRYEEQFTITVVDMANDSFDFGDAPSPYGTTLAADGARHVDTGPTLGTNRDSEDDGAPTAAADGDDAAGVPDDEDGVTFGPAIMVGQLGASLMVNVQNAPSGARLDAWIDFNADGTWGGPFEQIADNVPVANGDNTIHFDVPSWAVAGATYGRFRLSTPGDLAPTGLAVDGELEDYQLMIASPSLGAELFGPEKVIRDIAYKANSVFAADVDGDGDMDVLSASENDNTIAWYENDSITIDGGSFTPHTISSTAARAISVFAADVDGDGDMDVLSASAGDNKIAWYENDGNQNFTERSISTSAYDALSVFAADVDGDGDMDVLSASFLDSRIAWYKNDGSESFTTHTISTVAINAVSVFAADVDGDGDMDVLSASGNDDKIAWYENDGGENFTERVISTAADNAQSVFAADVDGDGDMDVLSASYNDNTIAWYENDGSESFSEHLITTAALGAYSVLAADVDGDEDMDVLSASHNDNTIAWYENDGGGGFTAHVVTTAALGARSVFAADVDGDGDLDVLSASQNDHKIAWYKNISAPTDILLPNSTVDENEPAGTTVGTFSTVDPDAGDTHNYTLVTGAGDADNASFTIDGDMLKTAESFDYETQSSYNIRVRSKDQGGLFTEKVFTIAVMNVNEQPEIGSLVDSPDPVTQGQTLALTANGVSDDHGVASVSFYRDVNGDGAGEAGELLGTDADGTDGWTWSGPATWEAGSHTYLARATDDGVPSPVMHSSWVSVPGLVQPVPDVDVWLVPRIAETSLDTSATLPTSDRDPDGFWQIETCDYYVEVWVRSDQADPAAISGGSVSVTFDPDYAQAASVDHGSLYTRQTVETINNATGVVSIGGTTMARHMGDDEYVCLGRILFQGIAPVDEVAHEAGPYDMALSAAAGPSGFAVVGTGDVGADIQPAPGVDIRANIYDIDDNGQVAFNDFTYFAPAYGGTVGQGEPPFFWWADFDRNGQVGFNDFTYFAPAYMKPFCDSTLSFPAWWYTTYVAQSAPLPTVLPAVVAAVEAPGAGVLTGDVNGDGRVSGRDRRAMRDAYGSAIGRATYSIRADLNGDGRISSRDRRILRDSYGTALSAPPALPAPAAAAVPGEVDSEGLSAAPAGDGWADHHVAEVVARVKVVQQTSDDAAAPMRVAGTASEVSLELRPSSPGAWDAVDDSAESTAQLEVDLGAGLASPLGR